LPATKALPKEMLPLVDKPVIQYSIEEAVAAGIEHVVVVTSSQKRPIEDHFDHNYELEQLLEEKGDIDNLREIRQIGDMVQISYVRQKEQLGLGHAVLMAKEAIGHEPFAVMLPDDVMVGDRPCIGQLIDAYSRTHGSVVAVMEVPDVEVSRYGVIDPDSDADTNDERLYKVQRLVEKPDAGAAPSNLAIIGRYVLTPKIFEKLESTPRGAGGEIQLTDAISSLISDEQDVYAYAFEGKRYDAGTTMGWLEASVELALERPDIGGEFRRFLSGLDLS
jgi:UTP--glucose-1-phosphate uridylyltransferase